MKHFTAVPARAIAATWEPLDLFEGETADHADDRVSVFRDPTDPDRYAIVWEYADGSPPQASVGLPVDVNAAFHRCIKRWSNPIAPW